MTKRPAFNPANGRTFRVIEVNGTKAPFKVLLRNPEGVEILLSHHKTEKLARAKCASFNPNIPVLN